MGHCGDRVWPAGFDCPGFCISHCDCQAALAAEAAPRAPLLAKEDPEIPKGLTSCTLDGQQYYPDCNDCRGHCGDKAWPFDCPAFCNSHCPCFVAEEVAPAVEAAPRAALLAKEDPEIPKGITSCTLDGQQYYPDCDVCRGHCGDKAWPFDCPAFCVSHCPCSVAADILV
jgi:hypothetical protein